MSAFVEGLAGAFGKGIAKSATKMGARTAAKGAASRLLESEMAAVTRSGAKTSVHDAIETSVKDLTHRGASQTVKQVERQEAETLTKTVTKETEKASGNTIVNTRMGWKSIAAGGAVAYVAHERLKQDSKEAMTYVDDTLGDAFHTLGQHLENIQGGVMDAGHRAGSGVGSLLQQGAGKVQSGLEAGQHLVEGIPHKVNSMLPTRMEVLGSAGAATLLVVLVAGAYIFIEYRNR